MKIGVRLDTAQTRQAFGNLEKQVRFATAVALTRTAQAAQKEVREQLPERFTIRSGWVAKGIRITPARKNNLQAGVRVLDDFMALQETGGLKASRRGNSLGIPVGARPRPESRTGPARFPGALLQKPGHFIAPLEPGSNRMALWRRTGRGRRSKMKLMYVFADQVRIEPRFGFQETVEETVHRHLQVAFTNALMEALRTAR